MPVPGRHAAGGLVEPPHRGGELLILLAGSILFCVGVSRAMNLSPLVTSLAVGATMVNLADRSRHLFGALSHTAPPFSGG